MIKQQNKENCRTSNQDSTRALSRYINLQDNYKIFIESLALIIKSLLLEKKFFELKALLLSLKKAPLSSKRMQALMVADNLCINQNSEITLFSTLWNENTEQEILPLSLIMNDYERAGKIHIEDSSALIEKLHEILNEKALITIDDLQNNNMNWLFAMKGIGMAAAYTLQETMEHYGFSLIL